MGPRMEASNLHGWGNDGGACRHLPGSPDRVKSDPRGSCRGRGTDGQMAAVSIAQRAQQLGPCAALRMASRTPEPTRIFRLASYWTWPSSPLSSNANDKMHMCSRQRVKSYI